MIKQLVPKSKYPIKCPYSMKATRIVVHNTANDATARNEIAYMTNNNNQTSFHFAVDDKEVVQGLPLNRNGWHAGDGKSGKGNREGIGIEICFSRSGGKKFDLAEQNAVKLIAELLKERKWGVDKVTKHQDYSGKYCPHRTLDLGWNRFIKLIEKELGMADELKTCIAKRDSLRKERDAMRKSRDAHKAEAEKTKKELAKLQGKLDKCIKQSGEPSKPLNPITWLEKLIAWIRRK